MPTGRGDRGIQVTEVYVRSVKIEKHYFYCYCHHNNTTKDRMDSDKQPQTKKQEHKGAKEKKGGANRLGSAKGARLLEANQERRKGNKKDHRN